MKKLSIGLLSTFAVFAAATGTTVTGCGGSGGSGNPGTGGTSGGAGKPIVPNADGFNDMNGNMVGIVGAWYAYGDWYGGADPAMPVAGGGDCLDEGCLHRRPVQLDHDADARRAVRQRRRQDVHQGHGGQGLDMMYSAIWGAGIGFDTNNLGSDGGTGKNAWDASANGVTGLSFHIDNPPTGGQMRVEFPTNAVPGTTDINAAYWGGETMNLSPFTKTGDYSFHWTDVGGPMYLTPHMPFDKTKIVSVQFHVVTNTSSSIPFDYCISNLRALSD